MARASFGDDFVCSVIGGDQDHGSDFCVSHSQWDGGVDERPSRRVDGKLIEIYGDVHPGEEVAARGTDALPPGTGVTAKPVAADPQGPPK